MIVIPAVDLHGGKCVRLVQGSVENETVYSTDPVGVAKGWAHSGCERLHVIDLDGAFTGIPGNLDLVLRIKEDTGIFIQMGGGVRSIQTIETLLKAGIDRVILGTIVFEEAGLAQSAFQKFPGKLMVALDAKDGIVAKRGWKASTGFPVKEALSVIEKLGGKEVIFADIGQDGTLKGINLEGIHEVMSQTSVKVYASGGVTTLDDVKVLKEISSPGCIVGKALYEGTIELGEAIRIAKALN